MTTYYIRKNGSDSNAGTSPSQAWLTFGKALGASGISSGDTVHVGAGVYRENVIVNMTSATQDTQIVGDIDGSQTGDAGAIRLTAYATNDKTASSSNCLNLNTRDCVTFRNIWFQAGTGAVIAGTNNFSTNIRFFRCFFEQTTAGILTITTAPDVPSNWLIDSCIFFGGGCVTVTLSTSTVRDYDTGIVIRNCFGFSAGGGDFVLVNPSGAGAFKGGGILVSNCTWFGSNSLLRVAGANASTSIPCQVINCVAFNAGSSAMLQANTAGQIAEDYNILYCGSTARTNVGAGSFSVADKSHAPNLDAGQFGLWGMALKSFMSPTRDSPWLGFGGTATPTPDFLSRPRPAGPGQTWGTIASAPGALEFHDSGIQELTLTDSGSSAINLAGPADQDFFIPVNITSGSITVRARYDSNYGTVTGLPQAVVTNAGQVGYAGGTVTMAGFAANTWETLSIGPFTPTAKGVVTLRLISRDSSGRGSVYFDTITGGATGSQGLDYYRMGEPFQGAVATAIGRLLINTGMNGV